MMHSGIYNIRVDIAPNTFVVFHNPNVLVQYVSNVEHVDWTGADAKARPKVIQRGLGELQELIQQGKVAELFFNFLNLFLKFCCTFRQNFYYF